MSNSRAQWHVRLEAEGLNPRGFVLMGQAIGQMLDLADRGLAPSGGNIVKQQAPSVDWATMYENPAHVLTQVVQSFDPTLGAVFSGEHEEEAPFSQEMMAKAQGIMERVDSMTDHRTGCFTEEAMQTKGMKGVMDCILPQIGTMLMELKVASDQVLALMTWGTTMGDLLRAAQEGDDASLFKVLSVNPLLAYHSAIARRIQHATATQEQDFLRKMQRAIAHRPHRHKNGKAGFIMACLWESGLKYLYYSQIPVFLKVVGLTGVPSAQALERYGQRLGLKKYHIDSNTRHENE